MTGFFSRLSNPFSFFESIRMAITLSDETKQRLKASLQRYCAANLDEEIGDLKAGLMLDFCLREIGPCIYNQAIKDAQAEMRERIDELDVSCYEEEFAYWRQARTR
jgi:uncharacterized protein (DUF2164 family)